ncbi:hypothetical protein C8F01DRAFT_1241857 [Mycena amicta]|nr:hypothetical protein C8F01DRAFT_1241857 [Mycena amicta]
MAQSPSPYLPRELERRIFRTAALASPSSARNSMLVACRVKEWVEPMLYRSLFIGSSIHNIYFPSPTIRKLTSYTFDKLLTRKSESFLASSVHNLLLANLYPEHVRKILSTCRHTKQLFFFPSAVVDSDSSTLGGELQLRRLKGRVRTFFDLKPPPPAAATTIIPRALARLTHLEIWDPDFTPAESTLMWAQILALPVLTHVACSSVYWRTFQADLVDTVLAALHPSGSGPLCAFIVIQYAGEPLVSAGNLITPQLKSNPGFVVFPKGLGGRLGHADWNADWSDGVLEEDDFWTRADDLIHKRRSGEVGREQYELLPANSV